MTGWVRPSTSGSKRMNRGEHVKWPYPMYSIFDSDNRQPGNNAGEHYCVKFEFNCTLPDKKGH